MYGNSHSREEGIVHAKEKKNFCYYIGLKNLLAAIE